MKAVAPATEIEPHVLLRREGAVGRITLNRPRVLNALTLDMVRSIRAALDVWRIEPSVAIVIIDGAGDRGLCAGGDIGAIHRSGLARDGQAEAFWREEYQVNALIGSYPKPVVAVMDGLVMGGGVGLSAHASHRVVTDRTRLAMPEVGIGFIPDVGGTWLLSRCPGEIGTYLGLTGAVVSGADAIICSLADYFVPHGKLGALISRLAAVPFGFETAWHVAIEIGKYAQPAPPSRLSAQRPLIDGAFAGDRVIEIRARLGESDDEFAREAARLIDDKSPSSLLLTLTALRRAASLRRLEDCLAMEYRVAVRLLAGPDLYAGIRAVVIDKTQKPQWQPPTLADAQGLDIERYFAPLPSAEWSGGMGSTLEDAT